MNTSQTEGRQNAVYNAYKKAKKEIYDETPKELTLNITKPAIIKRAMTYNTFPWTNSSFRFNDLLDRNKDEHQSKMSNIVKEAYKRAKKELYKETPPEMVPRITRSNIVRRAMTFDSYSWNASFYTFSKILNRALNQRLHQRKNDDNQ